LGRRGRRRAREKADEPPVALRRRRDRLRLAALPAIRRPLRRLRPSRPRARMVARRRRGRPPRTRRRGMSGPAACGLQVPPKTIFDQQRAARPDASAWVSANAGSGKTKVLADRVMRLLLAGTEPSRILCLTFTKAAAANMENRIFAELGKWVRLDDEALAA